MNPLNHFGIKTQFIRGDTTSYNLVRGTCETCGHTTDVSTQYSETKEKNIKICDDCLNKHNTQLKKQTGWGTPKRQL